MRRSKIKHRHYENPRAELVAAIEKRVAEKGEIAWRDAVEVAKSFGLYTQQVWAEFSTLVETGRYELELDFDPWALYPLPVLVSKKEPADAR
jgi:hypothetical protein